jgi:ribonuclease VapC
VTTYILDASALLAIIQDERGGDHALARLPGCLMSTVNLSEALMRGAEKGASLREMQELLATQRVQLIEFDEFLAVEAARLRPATRHLGLSFADRACIATAMSRGATVVTADRAWATLDLSCPIELIR